MCDKFNLLCCINYIKEVGIKELEIKNSYEQLFIIFLVMLDEFFHVIDNL